MRTLTTVLFFFAIVTYGQERNPIKLGLGIVAIEDTYDSKKTVTIYRDKDLKNKIEVFKLYGAHESIWPYYDKPDYGLCYFVCLEKNKAYYRILINDKDEGFLKADSEKYFKPWESLLFSSTVERLDAKTNPLREKPSESAITIDIGYQGKVDRLKVIDVIEKNGEHWIKVNYSKSGQIPCEQGTGDCGDAWIKWRTGDKLLVHILLLC